MAALHHICSQAQGRGFTAFDQGLKAGGLGFRV